MGYGIIHFPHQRSGHSMLNAPLSPDAVRRASQSSAKPIVGRSLSTECTERTDLVEGFHHSVLVRCVDSARPVALSQPEDGFYDRQLGGSGVKT
jgi:hypothetical protein